jgi:hypothetical protein
LRESITGGVLVSEIPQTQYAVHRLTWRKVGPVYVRLPGSTRVASFADSDIADAECRRLEAVIRAAINPFACGQALHERTSFDEGRLRDWMLDAGLTPPEDGGWLTWWQSHQEGMTALQRDKVWEACDRVRFHEVVECPARRVAYVVVGINWHYSDQDFYAGAEGGRAMRAFSTREKAEEYARKATRTERSRYTSEEPFRLRTRVQTQTDPLHLQVTMSDVPNEIDSVADAPMFEVTEIEVED